MSKLLERGLGLISTLILARLLLPADFGLVAMAAPVIALVELLGSFGLDYALIRSRSDRREIFDTAWTLKAGLGIILGAVLVLVAPLGALYLREPRIELVVQWLALGVAVQGLENTGLVAFRKDIRMGPDVALLLGKKLASLLIAAISALALGNYWALVIGTVGSRAIGVILSYILTPFRPRLALSAWRELIGFSTWIFVTNIISFVHHRASDAIIGRALGPAPLAFFSLAMDLAGTVTGEAMSSISRAAFPAFSKLSHDPVRLANGLRMVLSGLAIFSLPAGTLMLVLAEPLVFVLFGDKWLGVAPVLGSLAMCTTVMGIFGQITYVYMALDRPKIVTYLSLALAVLLLTLAVILFPRLGLQAAGVVYGALASAMAFGHIVCLRFLLPEFSLQNWIEAFWRPISSAALMGGAVYALARIILVPADWLSSLLTLGFGAALGAVVYITSLMLLWRIVGSPDGPEKLVMQALARIRKALRA